MRLVQAIYRALTARRRRRKEVDARIRDFVMRGRIEAIRARTETRQLEFERVKNRYEPGAVVPMPWPEPSPVVFFDPYKREEVKFEGGGGQSGGAGASASWEPAVADQCAPSSDPSPSCDASPSSND